MSRVFERESEKSEPEPESKPLKILRCLPYLLGSGFARGSFSNLIVNEERFKSLSPKNVAFLMYDEVSNPHPLIGDRISFPLYHARNSPSLRLVRASLPSLKTETPPGFGFSMLRRMSGDIRCCRQCCRGWMGASSA